MNDYFEGRKYKLIYVFRIADSAHKGCLKVGETSIGQDVDNVLSIAPNAKVLNKYARERINQYTRTAGITYELLYTEAAVYEKDGVIHSFSDHDVHNVLERSDIKRKKFPGKEKQGREWFVADLGTIKNAIKAVKEGRLSLYAGEISKTLSPIEFRPEQREAIDKTKKQFGRGNQMLWNAKMRFGKTLSALQVVKEMEFSRTLILTHRPVVDDGWYEDFGKIFYDTDQYVYGSKNKGEEFANLINLNKRDNKHFVWFASMQDLRGAQLVGGKFDKDNDVFATAWDLIIVDEAHEGTQTELGKAVMTELTKPSTKVLRLSGTPFNLLDDFKEDEIYTWDYVMEQRAKAQWDIDNFGDPNPYASLPRLNIYTYDLGRLLKQYIDEDVAFNFREFFRTDENCNFVHHDDVKSFLDLLTKTDEHSLYPFANDKYRDIFRHTLWVLPGVKAAGALSKMLREHPVFGVFTIANVAGEGDDDEERSDALSMVRNAIGKNPDESRTITLTCGRLTTGVSVKEWTGVLMLSGSYNTAASAYMQTIFRVQTPCEINGRMKEDCYVFDFAPDRTLQVLATVPRVSTKAGKTTSEQRKALGEFLNFCPVISMVGSEMKELNVDHMMQQLKRAYIEKVVRSGFEDGYLYNDELLKLTDMDLKEFNKLKGIIGQTKAIGNLGTVDINSQGLTNEQYEEMEKLSKKSKRELTPDEKARLEELKKKKKVRDDAISILRGISIRMPLLIYGADIKDENKELTIENFTSLVDEQSWEEFMPQGVSKEYFGTFLKYYDPDVFAAAGKRIRAMARAADKLTVEERIARIADIFSTFRNPDKETVLTPWRVVNMHLGDALGGYCFYDKNYEEILEEPRYIEHEGITDEVFAPASLLLEINSKSGLYPLYLAYNVYRRRLKELVKSPTTQEECISVWDQVVAENIFVICKTPMAKSITQRTLVGFRNAKVNTRYFENLVNQIKSKSDAFIEKVKKGKTYWKANEDNNMKYKVVVGNPPYQSERDSNRKEPVYHLFYNIAFRLADKVSLITPARFLFNVGQTPENWMNQMLNDCHFKVVDYFKNSTDVFPTVDIKGGVAITLRDASQDFGAIKFFSEYKELPAILEKVSSSEGYVKGGFSGIMSSRGQYKFSRLLFDIYPYVKDVQGSGTGSQIASNSMEKLPELFLAEKPHDGEDYIEIIGRIDNNRRSRWIKRNFVMPVDSLDSYKVIVTHANGSGIFGETLSTPQIGRPGVGHTDTFISIGRFDSETEAGNCLKYIRTKFFRAMLGTLKVTQNGPSSVYANVPLQNFTENSDIDWNLSIGDIDKQLYEKYGLGVIEQDFIEQHVKPM